MSRKPLGTCTYCRRRLTGPHDRANTAATKDHVMPRSVGGVRKVRCCRLCNHLKGDIHPSVWRWFTLNFPGWWRTFRSNREVVDACRPRWGLMVRVGCTGRAMRCEFERRSLPQDLVSYAEEAPLPHASE